MIRRVLLFIALATAGVLILAYVTPGGSGIATGGEEGGPFQVDPTAGRGVDLGNSDVRVNAQIGGAMSIPSTRQVPYGDGFLNLREYVLEAQDSRPLGDGERMELERVRLTWFRHATDKAGKPIDVAAGNVRARIALVAVGRNQKGRPSILQDRDMDLRDVVVTSLDGNDTPSIVMTVGRVQGRHTDEGLRLHTPSPEEPFTVEVQGDTAATITGRGMQLAMSPDRGNDGPQPEDRIRLDIRNDPVLVADGIRTQADGPMLWTESPLTNGAHISLDGHVQMRWDQSQDSGSTTDLDGFQGLGDRLEATLVRGKDRLRWRVLELVSQRIGARAQLTRRDGTTLFANRIATASRTGLGVGTEPVLWEADGRGEPVMLRVPDPQVAGEMLEFTSSGRVLTARIFEHFQGFSSIASHSWPSAVGERVVFEGAVTMKATARHALVKSESGATAWIGGGSPLARGRFALIVPGAFTFEARDWSAKGNAGFALARSSDGQERFRVGPGGLGSLEADGIFTDPRRLAQSRFTINGLFSSKSGRRSSSLQAVEIRGHGTCTLHRGPRDSASEDATGPMTIRVISPTADVELVSGVQRLKNVANLSAVIDSSDRLTRLRALAGSKPCSFEGRSTKSDERVFGSALEIIRDRPSELLLIGQPATIERVPNGSDRSLTENLQRTGIGVIRAARIRLVAVSEVGGDEEYAVIAMDPSGAEGLVLGDANLAESKSRKQDNTRMRAPVLVFLPNRVPSRILDFHMGVRHGLMPRCLGRLAASGLQQPWLLGRPLPPSGLDNDPQMTEPVVLEQREASHDELVTRASGERLDAMLVMEGVSATAPVIHGVLNGNPARLEERDGNKRTIAVGASVNFQTGPDRKTATGQSIRLSPSENQVSTLFLLDSAEDSNSRNMRLRCRGDIEVEPQRIVFAGPVHARQINADASDDPEGLDLRAQRLLLHRDPVTGRVTHATCENEVKLLWDDIRANADHLVLDLARNEFTAASTGTRPVLFSMGRQGLAAARRVRVNYKNRTSTMWQFRSTNSLGRR